MKAIVLLLTSCCVALLQVGCGDDPGPTPARSGVVVSVVLPELKPGASLEGTLHLDIVVTNGLTHAIYVTTDAEMPFMRSVSPTDLEVQFYREPMPDWIVGGLFVRPTLTRLEAGRSLTRRVEVEDPFTERLQSFEPDRSKPDEIAFVPPNSHALETPLRIVAKAEYGNEPFDAFPNREDLSANNIWELFDAWQNVVVSAPVVLSAGK